MKSDDDQSLIHQKNVGHKIHKLTRKRVMRRKNAVRRIQIHEDLALNNHHNQPDNFHQIFQDGNDEINAVDNSGDGNLSVLRMIFTTNPSGYRIYSTLKQTLLRKRFLDEYNPAITLGAAVVDPSSNVVDNTNTDSLNLVDLITHNLFTTNSLDPPCLMEDEFRSTNNGGLAQQQSVDFKNIPKVISMGLNVVLDIIKDSYEQNPKICVRSLESLYNLLQGLKPESLKNEPPYMIERYFDMIQTLIKLSFSSIYGRSSYSTTGKNTLLPLYENYHLQILELSLLSLITLSIARGDASKILNCIKILLIDCNVDHHNHNHHHHHHNHNLENQQQETPQQQQQQQQQHPRQPLQSRSSLEIEIPEILIQLNKHVCSYLLGKHSTPEWCSLGFPQRSLCETFALNYVYHRKNLNNVLINYKSKNQCKTSLTFDGQHLFLYRCNRIFMIGSGYNNTVQGEEYHSSTINISKTVGKHSPMSTTTTNILPCCQGGWIGFINGDLFVQPDSDWSSKQLLQIDHKTLKFKCIVSLISDQQPYRHCAIPPSVLQEENPFPDRMNPFLEPTLATTDGDSLILITVIHDDSFIIREFKPLKTLNLDPHQSPQSRRHHQQQQCGTGGQNLVDNEKIQFLLSSEFTIRLSSVCVAFCGPKSSHLQIPFQSDFHPPDHQANDNVGLKLLETNHYCDLKNVVSLMCGKDFALLLTDQGKVFYTGNANSLGIRHMSSLPSHKWCSLTIPKPVNIVQIAIGHEGNHALLLANDGTVFFVGIAKRGEDGESAPRASASFRMQKPNRVKKFHKIDQMDTLNLPKFVACNHGTSAIVTKYGDVYVFGKDAQHSNAKGLMVGLPVNFQAKSVALGKAHMLILSTKGLVITSGFSNKGQCGLNSPIQSNSSSTAHHQMFTKDHKPSTSSSLVDHRNPQCLSKSSSFESPLENPRFSGHLFTYGRSKRCLRCFNCTENGNKCPPMMEEDEYCQCGYGNSGCAYCGICSWCSQCITICKMAKQPCNNNRSVMDENGQKILWNSSVGKPSSSTLSSSLHAQDMMMESDYDCSSKMTSIAPTILPMSHFNPIAQIAAGLHHSLLLAENGDVYSFGSNQYGQLGVGDLQNRSCPVRLRIDPTICNGTITQIAAGSNHSVLLTSNGEVLTFGNNHNGQLGRSFYNICHLNAHLWNTFPDRMDYIGSEFGRLATHISCSGDFTFVHFDEILLSSKIFPQTKLMAEKNNLILIPPSISTNRSASRTNNQPELVREPGCIGQKLCRHLFCMGKHNDEATSGSHQNHQSLPSFNYRGSNILVISRSSGTCSILKQQSNAQRSSIDFGSFSSLLIDKFYQNFWAFNSLTDQMNRFNLITAEVSDRINQIILDHKTKTQHLKMMAPPTSMLNLYKLGNFNNNNNNSESMLSMDNQQKSIKFVPSIFQPDLSIPLQENCPLLKKTCTQLALELFSSLCSLTYSHLLGLSIMANSRQQLLDPMTHGLHKNLTPEEYQSVCRFEDYGGGWGYPPHSIEAIKFSTDCEIILGGIGLYGGRGEYNVQVRLLDVGMDGSEVEKDGDLLTETDIIHYECLPRQKYQIFFDEPILIQANRWYIVWASINGPVSDCGANGQAFVCTPDQVMFHFKATKLSNNGTDVNSGQIPTLYYKQLKPSHNDLLYGQFGSGLRNALYAQTSSAVAMDEEAAIMMSVLVSKDFVLKINANCVGSLCEILKHVWNSLKSNKMEDVLMLLNNNQNQNNLGQPRNNNNQESIIERIDAVCNEMRRNVYAACFSLELIRAYVQIFLPFVAEDNVGDGGKSGQQKIPLGQPQSQQAQQPSQQHYNQIQKFLHYDYDEYKRMAASLYEICSLLTTILMNPVQIHSELQIGPTKHHQSGGDKLMRQKFKSIKRLQNFFLDECHQTYQCCCMAFYPTPALKWSLMCDLLLGLNNNTNSSNNCPASSCLLATQPNISEIDQSKPFNCSTEIGGAGPSTKTSTTAANDNEKQQQQKQRAAVYSDKQLYLLSAVAKAYCASSIRLIRFLPIRGGSINDSFENFDTFNDLLNPDQDLAGDLACQIISKRLAEFHPFGDYFLCKDFTTKFVFEQLLNILAKPLQVNIENFRRTLHENNGEELRAASKSHDSNNDDEYHHVSVTTGTGSNYQQFMNNNEDPVELSTSISSIFSSNGTISGPSSSSPSSSSSSSSPPPLSASNFATTTFNDDRRAKSHGASMDETLDESQTFHNDSTTAGNDSMMEPDDHQQVYERKLLSSSCDLLLKLIAELHACSLGLINIEVDGDCAQRNLFLSQNEYATTSRFCRRSASKNWDTGSGATEAICFYINKPDIYVSGVRVYSSTVAQFKYQLQLLHQSDDECKMDNTRNHECQWKTLASVSGVYSQDDYNNRTTTTTTINANNKQSGDTCDIRFDRPVRIQPNVKYAILFKNYSPYSYSGDIGLVQLRVDDDIIFTFMECSLSKNGTNLNRGQIPQILFYHVPGSSGDNIQETVGNGNIVGPTSKSSPNNRRGEGRFDRNKALKSIVEMFQMTIEMAKHLLKTMVDDIQKRITSSENFSSTPSEVVEAALRHNPGTSSSSSTTPSSSSFSAKQQTPTVSSSMLDTINTVENTLLDSKILVLLYQTFDSKFFSQFLCNFIMYLKNLRLTPSLSQALVNSIQDLIPLISTLNKMIQNRFSSTATMEFHADGRVTGNRHPNQSNEEKNHHIIVESDHPYKPATVTSYMVKFPSTVKFMTMEFDPKCSTAQPEDYLEIYIGQDCLQNLNLIDSTSSHNSQTNTKESGGGGGCSKSQMFQNLVPIYKKFSGRNFDEVQVLSNQNWQNLNLNQVKASSNCLFVPGNEIVFLLKTSSDYIHSADLSIDAYYGFRSEVIGYDFHGKSSILDEQSGTCPKDNLDRRLIISYINNMLHWFECDLINLLGTCIDSMMNSSPMDIFLEILQDQSCSNDDPHQWEKKKLKTILDQKKPNQEVDDFELAQQVFEENFSILHQSLDIEHIAQQKQQQQQPEIPSSIQMIRDLYFVRPPLNSFLEDFIQMTPQSSGARLANWLQNEALIQPNSCLINVDSNVDCCAPCFQFLLESDYTTGNGQRKLCSCCHYQFFVKSMAAQSKFNNGDDGGQNVVQSKVDEKMFIKIVTRNQHEEIAYDRNALVEIQIRYVSVGSNHTDQLEIVDSKLKLRKQPNYDNNSNKNDPIKLSSSKISPTLQTILKNPYQATVKDKTRNHSITMMKSFESYCLEELRLEMHSFFDKKTTIEKIQVRSFHNGYYLGWWIPSNPGLYRIELSIDGETSNNVLQVNVQNKSTSNTTFQNSSLSFLDDVDNFKSFLYGPKSPGGSGASWFRGQHQHQPQQQQSTPILSQVVVKHSIRKFICTDSAGLRIRALPSLQSEQIGVVAVNGLLTIIDQLENDDGVWVRLSDESIQAYSTSYPVSMFDRKICPGAWKPAALTIDHKEVYDLDDLGPWAKRNRHPNGGNESPLDLFYSNPRMKPNYTYTLRTEAWALQFNKHFNRTLLVAIDAEDDIHPDNFLASSIIPALNNEQQTTFLESLVVPGWFQVAICGNDGHLIRNWPSMDEYSLIIGIVPLNEIIYAVECLQNEFGVWCRLSQDTLHAHISALYRSTLLEGNIDGWILVQSLTGTTYLCNIQQNYLCSTAQLSMDNNKEQQAASSNHKYDDQSACTIPTKTAISNRAAQCIRAVFAAFVWHEGILNDVLTAASYLKFNNEINNKGTTIRNHDPDTPANIIATNLDADPNELRKSFAMKDANIFGGFNQPLEIHHVQQQARYLLNVDPQQNQRRQQKKMFRHSVEVSQLMTMLQSSDVNSNVNFLEDNNNNNNNNNNQNNDNSNNNNNNNDQDDDGDQNGQPSNPGSSSPPVAIDSDDHDRNMPKNPIIVENSMPEILINLLQLWDFISTECLKIFGYFNDNIMLQQRSISMEDLPTTMMNNHEHQNNNNEPCLQCDCSDPMQQVVGLIPHDSIHTNPQPSESQCNHNHPKPKPDPEKENDVPKAIDRDTINNKDKVWRKHVNIVNMQQLYDQLMSSVNFLLSLVPSNQDYHHGKNDFRLKSQPNLLKRMEFYEKFLVPEDRFISYELLEKLGVKKSCYERRLAEEKLSDLVMAMSKHEHEYEDHQHLLSPDDCQHPSNFIRPTNSNEPVMENRKPLKFHRSISMGMNDKIQIARPDLKASDQHSYFARKVIENNNNHDELLEQDSNGKTSSSKSNKQPNMPFLCKPSNRLLSLCQKYFFKHHDDDHGLDEAKVDQCLQQSPLMSYDVFKFLFSCYNVDLYDSLVRGAVCCSAYRSLAMDMINWLMANCSQPSSIHDLMWIFVDSLLPPEPQSTNLAPSSFNDNLVEDLDNQEPEKPEAEKRTGNKNRNHIQKDVCRHPFGDLLIAGRTAEKWTQESLKRFMKTVANLLPLLPIGSPLQRMAIRCFGMRFNPADHIFLHECKVFSHISTILTRTSMDGFLMERSHAIDLPPREQATMNLVSKDVTHLFDIKASTRQSMVASLVDNSTETFWESGNEDRNKIKQIFLTRSSTPQAIDGSIAIEHYQARFVCVYIDNTRDVEYRCSQISWKLCSDSKAPQSQQFPIPEFKETLFRYIGLNNLLTTAPGTFPAGSGFNNENEKIKALDLDRSFCGWIQCELSYEQSLEFWNLGEKHLLIELNGPFPSVRIRQIKVLAIVQQNIALVDQIDDNLKNHLWYSTNLDYRQIQAAKCETETLRVFRLLTAQVFGKLLSNDQNSGERRPSSLNHQYNNENDLREHMVGILFSQSGKLTELQRQVCSHTVQEIHLESNRVREEWQTTMFPAYSCSILLPEDPEENPLSLSQKQQQPNDSYCFELLSLVLALSGSNIGREYLSQQKELLVDLLTLLHTSSDRVKRQVLALLRRVISNVQPETFGQLLKQNSMMANDCNVNHQATIDIFLACIAKSLRVQIKIRGVHSKFRCQSTTYTMSAVNIRNPVPFDVGSEHQSPSLPWWLKGQISQQISLSIIAFLKEMSIGQFGEEWRQAARNCIIENILKLTRLPECFRSPDECIYTLTLWLTLSSLCVLVEKDIEMLSTNNLFQVHIDQTNGNASRQLYCDNHDDDETVATIQCNICGHLCADCDRFLHLNTKTRSHKRQVFKDELDTIKVDIHEGCGRLKLNWSLVVVDSKLLKAMVEFRTAKPNHSSITDNGGIESNGGGFGNLIIQNVCRFCGIDESSSAVPFKDNVCPNEDCQRFSLQSCDDVLKCGHYCSGIANESTCLPCLHGCSSELKQDGDDMCMICFSESLFSAPCIQLSCKHVFHYHCVKTVLEKRWSGGRITFTFSQCPICKIPIDHPSLATLLEPIRLLYEDVKSKALMRLEYEGLQQCEAITTPQARFYNNALGFAMEKYSYYLCFKCLKAYYGGEARCDVEYDGNNFNAEELICGSCSDISKAQICSKHGTDFLEYKCRFCCSVAVYFCFGSTHFCNACHDDFQRLVSLKEYPQCPVGPHCLPMDGSSDECPLHVVHPPTGEEFALGCGICRNAHTF